ncbi:MAG: methylated-DNA--[protein]-cysteine S-methyltransferase [Eubacteriales bacterium]|nr:methylated-DNA--[protein]-cysteine S-methyltransferase [Eubacteriales bacterium]
MIYISHYRSPLGNITISGSETALTGLWFDGQKYFGLGLPDDCPEKSLPLFDDTKKWLDIYFSGKDPGFTPPLFPQATPFRKAVWDILLTIPFGQTVTYGEIAEKIAVQQKPSAMSARAVGGAVGHNPISLIIPCHRVLGAGKSLTGYAGGIEKKVKLLALEGVILP